MLSLRVQMLALGGLCGDLAHESLHDFARDDQSHHRRDERSRAGDVAAVGSFAGRAGRADAMVPAADGRVLHGAERLFLRVDDLELFDDPYIKRWYKLSVGME